METQFSPCAKRQLHRFCRQYLQVQLDLDYPDDQHLRDDTFQRSIYSRLFADHAIEHPPPPRYQLRVLKELTKRIEESIQDWDEEGISDDLMSSLSFFLVTSLPSEATVAQQKSYVTYTLSCLPPLPLTNAPPTTTLLEARSIVAASGTTGIRTWEASLHLGNYLCQHPSLIANKSILELGAGTSYISILCSKFLFASHALATDGSNDVVSNLATNFYLNGLQDSSKIEGKELTWGWALAAGEHPEWNAGRKIDVVLGADLTYDVGSIPALVGTFDDLYVLNKEVVIIYAGTVRNPKTFQVFLDTCRMAGWVVEKIEFEMLRDEDQMGPFYSDKAPLQLCRITKS